MSKELPEIKAVVSLRHTGRPTAMTWPNHLFGHELYTPEKDSVIITSISSCVVILGRVKITKIQWPWVNKSSQLTKNKIEVQNHNISSLEKLKERIFLSANNEIMFILFLISNFYRWCTFILQTFMEIK